MSLLGSIGGVLGDIGRGVGNVLAATLPQAIPAGLQYLTSREQSRAARDIAKSASGAQGPVQGITRLQAQFGRPMMQSANGGGNMGVLDRLGITGTAPYVQRMIGSAAGEGAQVSVDPDRGLVAAVQGGGLMVPGTCPPRMGGVPIASTLRDYYTEAGNPRGTVASIANGRLTYWSNRGQPVIFSRDAAICKRIKKLSGEAYRASGGSSRKR